MDSYGVILLQLCKICVQKKEKWFIIEAFHNPM
jgi:hypothetical protein